jgi:hypothetical protein
MYSQQTEEYAQQFRIYYGGCARDSEVDEPSPDLLWPTIHVYPKLGKHAGEMTPQILDIGGSSFLSAK